MEKFAKCEYCKEDFYKNRTDKRFCSRSCKVNAKDKRVKKYKRLGFKVRSYRKFDKDRNLNTNINRVFIEESLKKPCTYCGYKSTGLDRIDNNLGHTIENTVPCCRECNIARMNNFSHEEMKIIGEAIKKVKDNRINNG